MFRNGSPCCACAHGGQSGVAFNAGAAEALVSASRSCAAMGGGMPDLGVLGLVLPFATAFLILTSLTLALY